MKLKKIVLLTFVICMIFALDGCAEDNKNEYESVYNNGVFSENKQSGELSESVHQETVGNSDKNTQDDNGNISETNVEESTSIDYANGECGKNIHWALSVDGILTISGSGDMNDFSEDSVPWSDFRDRIVKATVNEGVTSIGRCCFYRCENLQSVSLPESVAKIEMFAFESCTSLESIELPDAVTELPKQAFSRCTSLKSITLPAELESIPDYAFNECTSLSEITLPSKVRYIGNNSFTGCTALKTLYLPSTVSSIGNEALSFCTSLTSVNIPPKVSNLSDVFFKCTGLREVYFEGDAPIFSSRVFSEVVATCYYPSGNNTWTIAKMADYGGDLTWESQ